MWEEIYPLLFPRVRSLGIREKIMKTFKHPLANQRGIVLVISLMVLALLLGAGVGAIVSVQTDLRSSGNFKRGTQAFYIAEAGINHARHELQDGDGTNDFDSIFVAAEGTEILSSNNFSGGTYTVTKTGSASDPSRIKVLSVGTLPNNTRSQIEAWFRRDAGRPPKAIETNDKLEIDGKPKILGTCGGAHTNNKMDVDGSPAVQMVNGLSSSDKMDLDGTPCIGTILCLSTPLPAQFTLDTSANRDAYEAANQSRPTYTIPEIKPADYAPKVAGLGLTGFGYILRNDGTVTTGPRVTCDTNGLCAGGAPVLVPPVGWSHSGGTWQVSGTTAANGVFYSETTVAISGSPGTDIVPWQATIISRHHIEVSGSPRIKPYPTTSEDLKNHLFVTGEHLKIDEGSNMKADYTGGAILVRGKVEIKGNPIINGFIIARDKGEIKGNMQITYKCDTGCSGPGCPLPILTMGSSTEKF